MRPVLLQQLALMWVWVRVSVGWMQWMWMLSCHKGRRAQTLQQLLLVQQECRMAALCRPHHSAWLLAPQTQALLLLLLWVQTDKQHHQLLGLVSMGPLHLHWVLLQQQQQRCRQCLAEPKRRLSCGS
jgi:hypothetical protein